MIHCELGIAVSSAEGDRGTWFTDYVYLDEIDEIDEIDDANVKAIEEAAIEIYMSQHASYIDIQKVWLYHWHIENEEE